MSLSLKDNYTVTVLIFQGGKNNSENDVFLNGSDLTIEFDRINNDVLLEVNEKGNTNELNVGNFGQPSLMSSHKIKC